MPIDGKAAVNRWELSHGKAGVNAPSWLTFEIHRPYFDGAEAPLTVIHAKAAVLAARRFDQRSPARLRFGMTMPASYRQLLTKESRLTAYRAAEPTDLPDELASQAWRVLSAAYRERAGLDLTDRACLAHWLVAACLHRAVLNVVPADLPVADCAGPVAAGLQSARAVALFGFEGLSDRTRAAYRSLVEAPATTMVHVQALASWGYLLARHAGDDSAAPALFDQAGAALKDIAAEISDFEHGLLTVRLTLRSVMYAERRQDFSDAMAQLADARQIVAALTPADSDDELLLTEARRRLIDRRVEIAARLGDAGAERDAIDEGLVLDPTCVKIHMQAGQAHERAGEHEQAMGQYLHAARLGPHGTAFALLRAAACARQIGHAEFARVLTERAFRAAPRAAATRDALAAACEEDGDAPLAEVTRLAAIRDPARPFANNWHYQMYASYFNLGESKSPCLYARLPTLAFEAAERGGRFPMNWQRLMPPAFRRNLIRESGLADFAVTHPADLPPRLRTPAWDTLCDWLAGFAELDTERKHLVAAVVFRLGFGGLVLDIVPAVPAAHLRTPAELRLQHWRDLVRYVTSVGTAVATPENSFAIGRLESCPTLLRFFIATFAVIFHGRETRSVDEAVAWREIGAGCLAELLADPEISAFEQAMLESRFYRSVSYLPFLRRDHERLAWEMARTEELARAVPATTEYEVFLARENLRACLETRSKSCYAFGEYDEGHALVAEVLAVDPYEPKSHIEMAQSLLMREQPRQAADSFLRTARLGPVSTALGYASAADCFAKAGQPVLAEDCYLQVLRLDPHAISAARGWAAVGTRSAMGALADEYLAGLEAWGKARQAARTG
jgi:tetratricopeptide (TPR) repeat protein